MDAPYYPKQENKLRIDADELQSVLDILLDIAEEHYPKYSSSNDIATVLDFYKKYIDEETNYCDKCKEYGESESFVWITAEDFEPKEGEIVNPEAFKKYDALCEECYQGELITE